MVKEKLSIGLDVGNRHINMVKLASDSASWRLVDFANVGLDPRQGKEEQLSQLKKMVQEKELANLTVNIGISGESVLVRYIDLPKMSNREIEQALKYEAQQYIPFKMEEVIFDYHILQPKDSTSTRMKILLVAAKKQVILEFVKQIQQAGLTPNLIDVDSFSLINCFQANGPRIEEERVFALINLEFDLVNINILQGKTPFFSRDISLLEDLLSLQQQAAQESELFTMMQPLLPNLVREIQLSIDYYETEFEKQVEIIFLSGEGARSSELISFLNNQLGRELALWNPLQNLIIDSTQLDPELLKKVSSMLALACGLALRGVK